MSSAARATRSSSGLRGWIDQLIQQGGLRRAQRKDLLIRWGASRRRPKRYQAGLQEIARLLKRLDDLGDFHWRIEDLRNSAVRSLRGLEPRDGREFTRLYDTLIFYAKIQERRVRDAALYAAYQCARVTGPVELTAPDDVKRGLVEEIDQAADAAHAVISGRIHELRAELNPD